MNSSEKLRGNTPKVSEGIIVPPKKLITADTTTARDVSEANILRVRVTATTYLAFGKDANIPAVTASTQNAIELEAGTYLIAVIGDFVRTSLSVARMEVV